MHLSLDNNLYTNFRVQINVCKTMFIFFFIYSRVIDKLIDIFMIVLQITMISFIIIYLTQSLLQQSFEMLYKSPPIFEYCLNESISSSSSSQSSEQNYQNGRNSSKQIFEMKYSSQVNKNMKYLLPIPFNNNNNHVYEQMINKYNTSQCYLIYKSIMNNNFNLLENYNLNNINLSKINIFQYMNKKQFKNTIQNYNTNMLDIYVPITNLNIKQNNSITLLRKNPKNNNNVRIIMNRTTTALKKMDNYFTTINMKTNSNNSDFQYAQTNTNSNINDEQKYDNYLYKYQIIKELGKGMYGVVHLARRKSKKTQQQNKKMQKEESQDKRQNIDNLNFQLQVWRRWDSYLQIKNLGSNQQNQKQKEQKMDEGRYNQKNMKNIQNYSNDTKIQAQENNKKISINLQHSQQKIFNSQKSDTYYIQQTYYAIKIYEKIKMSKDPQKLRKILQQISIMQNIDHPHIIKLYETVNSLTKISLVVQYGGNQSLLQYLKQNYPLCQAEQRKIGKQLLSALMYLHERNIVHRDIKLQNILMLRDQIKLIDFGFSTRTYKKTKLNTICGTPNYMAPEVLSKQQYFGENADIWSFGVVMYSIAEGRHPFNATNYRQLQRVVNKGVFQFVKITNPLHKAFIKKILIVKPENRPKACNLMSHPWLNIEDQQINMDEVD